MTIDIDTITEDEAVRLAIALERKFGWQGTFFTRGDADSSWTEYHEQPNVLTDEQWNKVQQSWYWRKGISQQLVETGLSIVNDAVYEALLDPSSYR